MPEVKYDFLDGVSILSTHQYAPINEGRVNALGSMLRRAKLSDREIGQLEERDAEKIVFEDEAEEELAFVI